MYKASSFPKAGLSGAHKAKSKEPERGDLTLREVSGLRHWVKGRVSISRNVKEMGPQEAEEAMWSPLTSEWGNLDVLPAQVFGIPTVK